MECQKSHHFSGIPLSQIFFLKSFASTKVSSRRGGHIWSQVRVVGVYTSETPGDEKRGMSASHSPQREVLPEAPGAKDCILFEKDSSLLFYVLYVY